MHQVFILSTLIDEKLLWLTMAASFLLYHALLNLVFAGKKTSNRKSGRLPNAPRFYKQVAPGRI